MPERCFSQALRAGWCHHFQSAPEIPVGVGAAPFPALSGGSGSKAEQPCTGSSSSSPSQCTQGLLRHLLPAPWAEVGTNSSVTATLAQQPGQQRHREQQGCLEAQAQPHSRARNEHRTRSMQGSAPAPLHSQSSGRAGVAVPGWGSCGCPQLPCPSWLPGTLPALTCLVVVVHLHLGWLQAPHGDVLLHREGEAEGLPAQLGKGSRRGSGGALHCRGSPGPVHRPQDPTLCPATHALGGHRAVGLAEGLGQTLGLFPILREALLVGKSGPDLCIGWRECLLRAGTELSPMRQTR